MCQARYRTYHIQIFNMMAMRLIIFLNSCRNWSSEGKHKFPQSGQTGIQTWGLMTSESSQSLPRFWRSRPEKDSTEEHSESLCCSYLSQDMPGITSPFGMKEKQSSLVWREKAQGHNVEQTGSNLSLFFSMWLPEVILVFISPNFPFSKNNSLKSSGKLTWFNLALGWPPHAHRIKRTWDFNPS